MLLRIIVLLALVSPLACHGDVGHDGALVGASCRDHSDCSEHCQRGGDYPDGICTVKCRDDRDCPSATVCIDKAGGVCLPLCEYDEDCRPRYDCKSQNRRSDRGRDRVCIGD